MELDLEAAHGIFGLSYTIFRLHNVSGELKNIGADTPHANNRLADVVAEAEPLSLEEGIARMAEWAKEVGPRRTPEFHGVELWKSIPKGWRSEMSED